MDFKDISPMFIDETLNKIIKNQYVEIKFTVKPDIAKEVITFVEKLISEDMSRKK